MHNHSHTHSHKIELTVEGMHCASCANTVTKFLESKELQNISVDFAASRVSFELEQREQLTELKDGIRRLGYSVSDPVAHQQSRPKISFLEIKFLLSLVFTLPLLAHMFLSFHLLHDPAFQLALTIPVYLIGLMHFGRSALGSLRAGLPNMDVLIFVGSSAAFGYSIAGYILELGSNYLFFETAASIITLVLLGNVLEHRALKQTTTAIEELHRLKPLSARRIISTPSGDTVEEVSTEQLKVGDTILVNSGDRTAADGEIIWGELALDESMISGESLPCERAIGSKIVSGTLALSGSAKVRVTAIGEDTVLAHIIAMVQGAQAAKPSIQAIGDRVSAVFVPVVCLISIATFLLCFYLFGISFQQSMLNAVAVLVVACPCAMGLATPTAVVVAIGRAAKAGILIKGGKTLELLAQIKRIVFDKTGTLTNGAFELKALTPLGVTYDEAASIILGLEQHSSHPIAKSLLKQLAGVAPALEIREVKETKGMGIEAKDLKGARLLLGSASLVQQFTNDLSHHIYLARDHKIIATIDLKDELRPETKNAIDWLKHHKLEPVLLSGDSKEKCDEVAQQLGIDTVYSKQLPHQKLEYISSLSRDGGVAFVGDGINDAPALALATVGISLSDATQVALQSAQVVLLKGSIAQLPEAILIAERGLRTIKQNLFWAFFYNILMIPLAACGYLSPMLAAFAMAFSDVIVIGNSLRLKSVKL